MEGSPSNKHGFETLVTLQPFIHQVGGHSTIQQFDQYTVCKPLFSKELRFYEEVCPAFKPFIPEFKGVVSVKDLKEHQDSVCQVVRSSDDIKLHIYRYGKHCNTCSCQRTKDISKNQKHENEIWSSDEESKSSSGLNYGYCNLDDSSLEYILLENVVGHYKYPCILDLKMGTEKHKDYIISKEEAERRQARWDQTTSRSLGVRVCGMKVYLVDKCEFFVMSTGRNLTIDGFKDAIKKFLYNGKRYRLDVIEPYLNQLGELLNIMENQSFYRFYNTSLLLIYEGDDSSETDHNFFKADTTGQRRNNDGESHGTILNESKISNVNVGVRMIDFAHVDYNNQTNSSALQPVPDENYLVGLRSVIRILKETLVELRTNETLTDS